MTGALLGALLALTGALLGARLAPASLPFAAPHARVSCERSGAAVTCTNLGPSPVECGTRNNTRKWQMDAGFVLWWTFNGVPAEIWCRAQPEDGAPIDVGPTTTQVFGGDQ